MCWKSLTWRLTDTHRQHERQQSEKKYEKTELVQGVSQHSPKVSWDRLQPPFNSAKDKWLQITDALKESKHTYPLKYELEMKQFVWPRIRAQVRHLMLDLMDINRCSSKSSKLDHNFDLHGHWNNKNLISHISSYIWMILCAISLWGGCTSPSEKGWGA